MLRLARACEFLRAHTALAIIDHARRPTSAFDVIVACALSRRAILLGTSARLRDGWRFPAAHRRPGTVAFRPMIGIYDWRQPDRDDARLRLSPSAARCRLLYA